MISLAIDKYLINQITLDQSHHDGQYCICICEFHITKFKRENGTVKLANSHHCYDS